MEDSSNNSSAMASIDNAKDDQVLQVATMANTSENLFPESPVYELDDEVAGTKDDTEIINISETEPKDDSVTNAKRKLSTENSDSKSPKIQKTDQSDKKVTIETANWMDSQSLDDEICSITSVAKINSYDALPSTSSIRTPVRSSPRKIGKRSNSVEVAAPKTPRTPKTRAASVDISKNRKTPRKCQFDFVRGNIVKEEIETKKNVSLSRPSVEFVREILPAKSPEIIDEVSICLSRPSVEFVREIIPAIIPETIDEESFSEAANDSQNICLGEISPTPEEAIESSKPKITNSDSDPAVDKDTEDMIGASDSKNISKLIGKDNNKGKSIINQERANILSSVSLDSPEHVPIVTSKLISKLSNGNSSTPTEQASVKNGSADHITPDSVKLNGLKGTQGKNESFRASNVTTPSTISPLQNGHSLQISTPQIPVFDIHVAHNEDGEFLSLYVVRTDNDVGMDMCKEYQRISKRFTIDPYLGDISTSPSSITSGVLMNLPDRTSFASTISSSSSSSNRTCDGAFVVPLPPRKSATNPSTSVKGYDGLMKKLQEIFSHIREASIEESNGLTHEEKVSIGVQTFDSLSNGSASPEEVGKCDKTTPKSSLKKTRVRGRRPIAGKTKRALLPTQHEETEFTQVNSPEPTTTNGDSGKMSPNDVKDEKPLSALVGTPKSVSKLKQKRRPTSPRPATPVEKIVVKPEYPGFAPDTVVLAKWVDKRYYSGKVLEITEPNKYLIKFDDGQSKVLLDDFIIFGDVKKLPLQGQSVYALVDEEQNYEPGLVLDVEENNNGTVTYRCTTDGDTIVIVTASELYLTEDQARSLKESGRPRSPSAPSTPRRRHHRELDLDNIIQGPRSARSRDKGNSSARKRVASPKSPKASTSGVKSKSTPIAGRKRVASESSEMSESSNSAPPLRLEEVTGVEPEVQRTPRKIDGVKAGPLQLKGAAKQNIGKKNSKLTKFENDEDTVSALGPIPHVGSSLFAGMHFLLTCTEPPRPPRSHKGEKESEKSQETRHYSSEEDGETSCSMVGTDTEDLEFCDKPFNKERLKEQLEAGGGVVYSDFDDVPKSKYACCKLIAPRPCLTIKYILCLASDVRALSHAWVVRSCAAGRRLDTDAYALPTGLALQRGVYCSWVPPSGKRNTTFFKDKVILICGDHDTFVKFWDRVCTLAGATTRVVNEEDLNMSGAFVLVTDLDCPHEVQNKANQDNIPIVSPMWVKQCLIEGKLLPPTSHDRFSFMYAEPE